MSIQGLQITKEEIRYVFPKEIRNIAQFIRVYEIKKKLKLYFQQFAGILPNFPYRSRYPSNANIIVFQCTFCPNKLVYEVNRQKGKYELKTFCVDHVHGINFDNQEIKKNEPVEQFPFCTENITEIIRLKTQLLRQPLAQHLESRKKSKLKEPASFDELVGILRAQNYYVSYEPENLKERELMYPDFLLISSEEMKKTYHQYARCVGFDFTYSLIKETPLTKYGKREYIIGLIAGLNSYRRIGIYALVVANEQSGYYVEKAFTQFIRYMQKEPESIVTDQSLGMLAGMKKIKEKGVYTGNTFWDTFHVLKTYKFRNKLLKSHMRKMVRVKCKYQFHKMYLQAVLMARTEDEMDAIHKFMHEAHKYCISQIPPDFIGLGVSDSQNEMVNNLIKNELPYESKYIKVVHKILAFIEQRNLLTQMMSRQTCRIDEVVNSNQLKIVRHSLCRTVYSFLFIQICRCCKLDLIFKDIEQRDFYCIQDINTVHYVSRTPIQQLKYFLKSKISHIKDGYSCTCLFQQKTGIPCQHILKVIFETDKNFIDRIDQYWVVEDPNKLFKCISSYGQENDLKVKKRGRPSGKPTLFFNPLESSDLKLPQGISTFEPAKPRGNNQAYPQNNKQMQFFEDGDEEEGEEEQEDGYTEKMADQKCQTKTNMRVQKMKNFYSSKGY